MIKLFNYSFALFFYYSHNQIIQFSMQIQNIKYNIYIYIRNNNCSLYKNFITINNLININYKISCFNKDKLSNSKIIIFIVYIFEETNSINHL